jgi:hypothetical protein
MQKLGLMNNLCKLPTSKYLERIYERKEILSFHTTQLKCKMTANTTRYFRINYVKISPYSGKLCRLTFLPQGIVHSNNLNCGFNIFIQIYGKITKIYVSWKIILNYCKIS